MCQLLRNLTSSEEFETWTIEQQSLAIQAVCIACGECFKNER